MSELSTEHIRMLAGLERDMDVGRVPFVVLAGRRVTVIPEVMLELGLIQGQTVTDTIFRATLQQSVAYCEAQIALQKASTSAATKKEKTT